MEHPSPTARRLVAARGLDRVVRVESRRPGLSEIPTVPLVMMSRPGSGMPADWIADATAELERRAQEAREYTGDDRPHLGEAMRLPTGYRLFVGGEV